MNIELLEKKEYKIFFIIDGISVEMANAIRRIMFAEVPVMAIEDVIILKNDSPLYDEIIAHRLGLIPLKTDLEHYVLPQECECGGFGCPLCQVSLTCEITNTTNSPLVICSGDLKSNDPNVMPVNPNIPIVKIDKNDKIILESYAILGTARDHAKWQPVSSVYYRYYPDINFDNKKCAECPDKCIVARLCSKKLYNFSPKDKAPKLVDDYQKSCDLCNSCQKDCPNKAIKVGWKENKFLFYIESDGVLPFDVLIKKTFEIFLDKIEEFVTKLGEIELK